MCQGYDDRSSSRVVMETLESIGIEISELLSQGSKAFGMNRA